MDKAEKHMIRVLGKEVERDFFVTVVIMKTVVAVGLVAGYFLPPEHAWKVGIATNLIWLYKV